jgi:sec-independent protein translocase protein TatB
MNFFNIGTAELLLIFVIALIVVGPRRLPEIARSLGKVVNDVRKMSQEFTAEVTRGLEAPAKELTEVKRELEAPVKGLTEVTQGLTAPVKELTKELAGVTQGLKDPAKELAKELTEATQELETPAKELKETTDQNASEKAAQGDQDNG